MDVNSSLAAIPRLINSYSYALKNERSNEP